MHRRGVGLTSRKVSTGAIANRRTNREQKGRFAMNRITEQWQDAVNCVLGIWLFLSPWILGFAGAPGAAWNAWIVGVIITAASVAALTAFQQWEEWVNFVLGIWLVISPWVVGFSSLAQARNNAVIVGVVVAALAIWNALTERPSLTA
jgi:hypothetical protein